MRKHPPLSERENKQEHATEEIALKGLHCKIISMHFSVKKKRRYKTSKTPKINLINLAIIYMSTTL